MSPGGILRPYPQSKSKLLSLLLGLICIGASACTSANDAVPFDSRTGFVIINADVYGHPARMLVDTGGITIVDERWLHRWGLSVGAGVGDVAMGKGPIHLYIEPDATILVGQHALTPPHVFAADLSSSFFQKATGGIDGFLGSAAFEGGIIQLDFPDSEVRFVANKNAEAICRDALYNERFFNLRTIASDLLKPVLNDVRIDRGEPLRAELDTGINKVIVAPGANAREIGGERYFGAARFLKTVRLRSLSIGRIRVPEPTISFDLYGPNKIVPFRLGTTAFREHTVQLDYRNWSICIR